jgi:hypothetical protein
MWPIRRGQIGNIGSTIDLAKRMTRLRGVIFGV